MLLGEHNMEEDFDVLIIGAGISGIVAAYHLQKYCKWASYAILERRSNIGGTRDRPIHLKPILTDTDSN